MISVQLRQALLNLMWEGGYQVIDAGQPVQRATFDAMQRLVRNEPLEGEPQLPPPWSPPVVIDPLGAFFARAAVSQNCAWVLVSPQESGALRDRYGDKVSQYNQFYTVGGSGGLGIAERVDPTSPSGYSFVGADGQWHHDVGGAADARVAEIGAAQDPPRRAPGPIENG
jgi:hypothetical protein